MSRQDRKTDRRQAGTSGKGDLHHMNTYFVGYTPLTANPKRCTLYDRKVEDDG